MGACYSKNIIEPELINNAKDMEYEFITTRRINDTNNLYVEKTNKKCIIFYYPSYSKLPLKGWIHYCMFCKIRTGKIQLYSKINKINIYFQICNKCWKKND